MPIAEETGLIGELGSYVLSQALEEASRWHKILPRERDPLFVSVNVSSRQLFRQDLVQEIRLMLRARTGAARARSSLRSPSRWSWRTQSAPWRS